MKIFVFLPFTTFSFTLVYTPSNISLVHMRSVCISFVVSVIRLNRCEGLWMVTVVALLGRSPNLPHRLQKKKKQKKSSEEVE